MSLRSAIYLLFVPVMLLFAVLACGGTVLTALPTFICPTAVPATADSTADGTPDVPSDATPYIIQPPQDFYLNDAIYVGGVDDPQRVRFRLQAVAHFVAAEQSVYSWSLEVSNLGTADYLIFPAAQMVLTDIVTNIGTRTGSWAASSEAGTAAGVTVDSDLYTLLPGTTAIYHLAAFAPSGTAWRFALSIASDGAESGNTITWRNQPNPYCSGDLDAPVEG